MFKLKNGLSLDVSVQSIVDFYADAIVIPTNTTLDWESDLMATLRKRAGRSMLEKAGAMAPIDLGEALATTGGGLLSTFVIHVALFPGTGAGPRRDGEDVLRAAIKNILLRCAELGIENVGMPNLGGYLGLSEGESARITLGTLEAAVVKTRNGLREAHLVLAGRAELEAFDEAACAFSV